MFATLRLLILLAAASLFAATAGAREAGEMRLQLVRIMDPSGFEKPMVAATSLVPADWTTEGAVYWNLNGRCTGGQQVDWTAVSPDGEAFIHLLPAVSWRYNNQNFANPADCINGRFDSADAYVNAFAGQSGGRVVDVQRDPASQQLLSQYPFFSEQPGDPYTRIWSDTAAVTYEYSRNGVPYTAVMVLFTRHNHTIAGHSSGYSVLETGYGVATNRVVFAAPSSSFGNYQAAFQLFTRNYRVNPEWQARMARHGAKMSEIAIESGRKIAEITSKTYSDISDQSMESWRRRNESFDTGTRETSEWIRGVETYDADTPTGQVELPTGYDRAFQMNDGTFVVTNDHFFDPMDGRQLGVTQ